MKEHNLFYTLIFCLLSLSVSSQVNIEGYVYQEGNRGFLNRVEITAIDKATGMEITKVLSNVDGFFQVGVFPDKEYTLLASKEMFHLEEVDVSTKGKVSGDKVFSKIEMRMAPGYVFEITLADKRDDESTPVNAIKGALIEVYNNTTKKLELILENHPHPDFRAHLFKGNHYTVLVRKKGYLTKRMEAFVDVEGCILCFEGVGNVEPGVSDNLTEGNETGVLLANVEMEKVEEGKTFEINNIYYDFGKSTLQKDAKNELNKVITIFSDNPDLIIELGSHSDSRGTSERNLALSERRAIAAVNYLKTFGNIANHNIIAKGYGESKILNRCKNGVKCEEEEHAKNRRTELKIVGFIADVKFKSLIEIKEEEKLEELIKELQNQDQIKLKEGEQIDAEGQVVKKAEEEVDDVVKMEEETKVGLEGNLDSKTEEIKDNSEEMKKIEEEVVSEIVEEVVEEKDEEINKTEEIKIEEAAKQQSIKEDIKDDSNIMNDAKKDTVGSSSSSETVSEDPLKYTYRIVIHFTQLPLPKEHKIFTNHEDVFEYKSEYGHLLYLIGNYKTEAEAKEALNSGVLEEYPNAYVVTFQGGKRV